MKAVAVVPSKRSEENIPDVMEYDVDDHFQEDFP